MGNFRELSRKSENIRKVNGASENYRKLPRRPQTIEKLRKILGSWAQFLKFLKKSEACSGYHKKLKKIQQTSNNVREFQEIYEKFNTLTRGFGRNS